MDWLLIYSDKGTFSSDKGAWEDAPGRDVQVGLFRDPDTDVWTIRHGAADRSRCDFFRLDADGSIVGMDLQGMIDYVVHEAGIIKEGRMLSSKQWGEVLRFGMEKRNELRK